MKKRSIWIAALCAALAVGGIALFFHSRALLAPDSTPRIGMIQVTVGRDGAAYDCDLSEEEIPPEQEAALLALLDTARIRRRVLPYPQNYAVLDDSVHITIWVLSDTGTPSMDVYLCSRSDYNAAQIGDTRYAIVDAPALYEAVYALLEETVQARAVKR